MIFQLTPRYRKDFKDLTDSEKAAVLEEKDSVHDALSGDVEKYRKHRIKTMEGWPGIWEGHIKQNIVFTFEKNSKDGETIIFFRRIGSHDIYNNP